MRATTAVWHPVEQLHVCGGGVVLCQEARYCPSSGGCHSRARVRSLSLPCAALARRPYWEGRSFFSIALICTTRNQIPAGASTNQRPENGDVTPL